MDTAAATTPAQPRLAPLEPPYPAAVAEDFARLMPPGMAPLQLFRSVAHNPRVLRRMRRGGLLDPGSISLRERELMILRTCARCGAEYEWGVHVAFFGRAAGFSPEQTAATVQGGPDAPCWSAQEALLIRLADSLHERADVDDGLWQALAAHWQPAQLVELLMLAGLYHAVSYLTNGLRIAREPSAPPFPPAAMP